MSSIEEIRHSFAHLLASAVLEHFPHAKLTLGPAIENGFYYDIFTEKESPKITDLDLKKLENTMRKHLKEWGAFTHREINEAEARELFKDNPFKLELIDDIVSRGEKITLYKNGSFEDLCRGGHGEASEMHQDAFSITHVAGAYWRGDEKNPMLTRIYGLAFNSKDELAQYLTQQEEAKKRDHRKLGKELGLFVFSELVGAGLPLWTPRGTMIRELLNDYVWELRKARGYQKVTIPHITKRALYETSGHWAKYAEDLFKIKTREDHEYAMKPMNCPHHAQIFASEPKSYRDMPQRFAETTMVYRDEQSGELSGLSRVLSITQDDAHVFCRENQIEEEANKIWDIINTFYGTFGFTLTPRFSRHDPAKPENYLGSQDTWSKAEGALKSLMEKRGVTWIDGVGEAAFYGPKIDFMAKDSIGRTWQVATIQVDFNQPKNFGLVCTNEKGEKEQIVMIHAAIMGSIERFMSVIIEHLAGNFPLWLAPTQVAIVPVGESHLPYAKKVFDALQETSIRATLDATDNSLGKRIRAHKEMKVPYVIVIGDNEVSADRLTIEARDKGKLEGVSITELTEMLRTANTGRTLA